MRYYHAPLVLSFLSFISWTVNGQCVNDPCINAPSSVVIGEATTVTCFGTLPPFQINVLDKCGSFVAQIGDINSLHTYRYTRAEKFLQRL